MKRTELLRITEGGVYRRHDLRLNIFRIAEDIEMDLYQVEGFALDERTLYEVVIYRGLDGADKGQRFVCSLHHFALYFRPMPNPQPLGAEESADKTAGFVSESVHG